MRKYISISIVLALSLIILSSGSVVQGLAFPQLIQIEGFQEAEIITVRAQNICKVRIKKQINSNPGTGRSINTSYTSDLIEKGTSLIFSHKNDLFIKHCCLLI